MICSLFLCISSLSGFLFLYTYLSSLFHLIHLFFFPTAELILLCDSSVMWPVLGSHHKSTSNWIPSKSFFYFYFFRNQIRSRTQWKEIWWDLIQCPYSRLRSFGSVAFSPPPETSSVPEMMAQKEWDWILCTFQLKSFKREARYSTVTFSGPQK